MKIGECATIRTGLVLSRKEAPLSDSRHKYMALSLKNIADERRILLSDVEEYYSTEALKREYFTQNGDLLIRLSAPYTVVLIAEEEENLLIPSHFAIIRIEKAFDPKYLHWWLTKNKKRFYQMASGGTMMGTISSGYIAEMSLEVPPIEKQLELVRLLQLSEREQKLLALLSKKKKQLIDAALLKIINDKGEITI